MNPERWQRLEALLDAALDLPAEDREPFLRRECVDAPELVEEVLGILRAGERSRSVLDTPASALGARLVDGTAGLGAPRRVGPYRIERLIGEGGMGRVYLAHRDDGEFDQRVALKLVGRGLDLDARIIRRFREERQILAGLNHSGIARLLDGGLTEEGLPFFAMEFVEGVPIDTYCDAQGLGVDQRLELFARVCDAVAHAHGKQVVHRDIKPSNILVTDSGEPRLLDFGIAKLLETSDEATDITRRSERLMTPEYASPEQIRGEPVVIASDVYCLGVLLYELLTGQRPFTRVNRTVHELERVVLEEDPTRPSDVVRRDPRRRQLKGDIDAIILTAMEKEPQRRYPSAAELGADVRRHLAHEPVMARGKSPLYRSRRWARRNRLMLSSAVAGSVVGAGLLFVVAMRSSGVPEGDPILRTLRLSAPQHLTNDELLELDPAISPDGKQVAYAGGMPGAMRIFVRQREGTRAVSVSDALGADQRRPRWSPDGALLLFQARRGIWVVPAAGGSPRLVVEPTPNDTSSAHSADWSRDGQHLAWVARDTVFTRPLDGDRPSVLSVLPVAHSLAWSPDGRWIAAVSGNAEFVYHRLGNLGPSALHLLPARCESATPCRPVVVVPPTALNTSPEWLDATRLIFVSNRDGARDLFAVSINEAGTVAGEPVRLSAGNELHTVSAAADGRTLAYSIFRQSSNIWSLDISSGHARDLADAVRITAGRQTVEGLDLSPDGNWIAFDANRTGQQDIYVIPVVGGEPERVVDTPEDEFHPAWSPDGKFLAFHTFRNGVRRAAIAPARGGPVRLVHPEGPEREEHTPVWTRDGQGLVYFRTFVGGADLFIVRRTSDSTWGAERQLTRNGGLWPSFASNGSLMSYIAAPGQVRLMEGELQESSSRLVLSAAAPEKGHVFALTSVLTPDGSTVIVKGEDSAGPGFWSVPSAGGKPRLLARLTDSRRTSNRPEFASDGRRVFFLLAEREADIWAVRLDQR